MSERLPDSWREAESQGNLPVGRRPSRARQSRAGRTIAPRPGEPSHIVTVEPWRPPPQTQGAGAIAGLKPKFGERLRVASRKRHHPRPSQGAASQGFERQPALWPFDCSADFFWNRCRRRPEDTCLARIGAPYMFRENMFRKSKARQSRHGGGKQLFTVNCCFE